MRGISHLHIAACLQEHGPMTPAAISAATRGYPASVRDKLSKMVESGAVLRDYEKGKYRLLRVDLTPANYRDRITQWLLAHPGASLSSISTGTGIALPVTHAALNNWVKKGQFKRAHDKYYLTDPSSAPRLKTRYMEVLK